MSTGHKTETVNARLVSKKQIHTGQNTGRHYLTGLDIFGGLVTVPLFYLYPQGLDVALVERSLASTLKKYPLVAGRMKKDSDGYSYIDADDAGVPFEVYAAEGPLPAYGPDYPSQNDVRQYYQRVFPWTIYKPDTPVFSVRIYRFADGGAILSVAPVHTLIDGSSLWMFIQDWSRAALGQGEPDDIVERDYLLNLSKQCVGRPFREDCVGAYLATTGAVRAAGPGGRQQQTRHTPDSGQLSGQSADAVPGGIS